jgi:hypothetical protein
MARTYNMPLIRLLSTAQKARNSFQKYRMVMMANPISSSPFDSQPYNVNANYDNLAASYVADNAGGITVVEPVLTVFYRNRRLVINRMYDYQYGCLLQEHSKIQNGKAA